jgi:hypothetical protein
MNPETVFQIANCIALTGWILLVFGGCARWTASVVSGLMIPLLLALVYCWLIVSHWGETPGSFQTLEGVATLMSNHWILVAGWVHYLTFDLFIGSWELRDARERRIPHLVVVPCLLLTFLFGPAGLLLYFAVRFAATRTAAMQPDKGLDLGL